MCCDQDRQRMFMEAQCAEACKHKWILSEKVGHDVGREAVIDWIRQYASQFREWWEREHGKVIE